MTLFRAIPIHVHAALEVAAAPILMVAPFALGFTPLAGALSIGLGILLLGSPPRFTATPNEGTCR